jgi:hypothetical protein
LQEALEQALREAASARAALAELQQEMMIKEV